MNSMLSMIGLSSDQEGPASEPISDQPIPPVNEQPSTSENNKRKSADDSNLSDRSFSDVKRSNVLSSSPISDIPLTIEQTVCKVIEESMRAIYNRLDKLVDKLDDLEGRFVDFQQQGERHHQELIALVTRVDNVEERAVRLEERVVTLESRTEEFGWSPSVVTDIKVKLLGDSNFSNKIKFGSERGTMGSSLPGSSQFCAKIEDLPALGVPAPGELNDCSDVVLGVGTNNLKLADADPLATAQKLYHKILSYRREIPNTRLILPGVLPSGDSAVNERVKIYNKHLADICNSRTNNMIKFVDTRVFGDREGKLRSKFRCENDGDLSLHVNHEGIKLLDSRIKATLREGHHLPTGPRFGMRNRSEAPPVDQGRGTGRGRRNYRGRGTSRGGSTSIPPR